MSNIRIFLSHKYMAPAVNRAFYGLLMREDRTIQFEVDQPRADGRNLPTNVTRLERSIRDADGFVGIYPLPDDAPDSPDAEYLSSKSRYFRLEMDMADRAGIPAIIFYDHRLETTLGHSRHFLRVSFDPRTLPDSLPRKKLTQITQSVDDYYRWIDAAFVLVSNGRRMETEGKQVGIALPNHDYSDAVVEKIATLLKSNNWDPGNGRLPWPPCLQHHAWSNLENYAWILVDGGIHSTLSGIVPYLHHAMIPLMRMKRLRPEKSPIWPKGSIGHTLFGDIQAGYPKDEIRWKNENELLQGIRERLELLSHPRELIHDEREATRYFRRAAIRPERVFVSYAGKDADYATTLVDTLKHHFEHVFSYRHPGELLPGEEWQERLIEELNEREIGVIIYSEAYEQSKYCDFERKKMVRQFIEGKMTLFPIVLTHDDPRPSDGLEGIQYMKAYDLPVEKIGALLRKQVADKQERQPSPSTPP